MNNATPLKVFRSTPSIKTYRVRCDTEGKICKQQDVFGTPQIRLYSTQGYEVYTGPLDSTLGFGSLVDWVHRGIQSNVIALTETVYTENIHKGQAWMVLFCDPWSDLCLHAQRRFQEASVVDIAHKYVRYHDVDAEDTPPPPTPEQQPRFGTIDCGAYAKLCDVWNMVSYPSAIYFDAQSRSFVFQGDFQDSRSVVDHILDVHNPPIIELNPDTFEEKIMQTQSWCAPLLPHLPLPPTSAIPCGSKDHANPIMVPCSSLRSRPGQKLTMNLCHPAPTH
jgi:hypothetical protein